MALSDAGKVYATKIIVTASTWNTGTSETKFTINGHALSVSKPENTPLTIELNGSKQLTSITMASTNKLRPQVASIQVFYDEEEIVKTDVELVWLLNSDAISWNSGGYKPGYEAVNNEGKNVAEAAALVKLKTDNAGVAKISDDGKSIIPVAAGKANISFDYPESNAYYGFTVDAEHPTFELTVTPSPVVSNPPANENSKVEVNYKESFTVSSEGASKLKIERLSDVDFIELTTETNTYEVTNPAHGEVVQVVPVGVNGELFEVGYQSIYALYEVKVNPIDYTPTFDDTYNLFIGAENVDLSAALPAGGPKINFISSNPSIAEVKNIDGVYTLCAGTKTGVVTVTAAWKAVPNMWNAGYATFQVNVNELATFDFPNMEELKAATENVTLDGHAAFEAGHVTCKILTNTGSNAPLYHAKEDHVRFYKDNYLTLSVPNGFKITQVTVEHVGSVGTTDNAAMSVVIPTDSITAPGTITNVEKQKNTVWTASESETVTELTLTAATQSRFKVITVLYEQIPLLKLGDISGSYFEGDEVKTITNGSTVTVQEGTTLTFISENAKSMVLKHGFGSGEGTEVATSARATVSWTPVKIIGDEANGFVSVRSTLDPDTKDFRFKLIVIENPETALGDIIVTYPDGATTISVSDGDTRSVAEYTPFSIKSANAQNLEFYKGVTKVQSSAEGSMTWYPVGIDSEMEYVVVASRENGSTKRLVFNLTITETDREVWYPINSIEQIHANQEFIIADEKVARAVGNRNTSGGVEKDRHFRLQAEEVEIIGGNVLDPSDKVMRFVIENEEDFYLWKTVNFAQTDAEGNPYGNGYLWSDDSEGSNHLYVSSIDAVPDTALNLRNTSISFGSAGEGDQTVTSKDAKALFLVFQNAHRTGEGDIVGNRTVGYNSGMDWFSAYSINNSTGAIHRVRLYATAMKVEEDEAPHTPTYVEKTVDGKYHVEITCDNAPLHVWYWEVDKDWNVVSENGRPVGNTRNAPRRVPSGIGWMNQVGEAGDTYTVNQAEDAENTVCLFAKSVKNNYHSEDIYLEIDPKAGINTAVDEIDTDESGETLYYNLQGVRVENPSRGLYIRIRNGQAAKILL